MNSSNDDLDLNKLEILDNRYFIFENTFSSFLLLVVFWCPEQFEGNQ